MRAAAGWFCAISLASLVLAAAAWAGGKKGAASGERNPAWFACASISDCTVAEGICGSPSGVNVRYLEAYGRWVQSRQQRIRCAGGMGVTRRATVACEQGVCTAGPAPDSDKPDLRAGSKGSCHDLSDCIVAHGVCGAPVGIVASKRRAFEKDVRRRAVAVDCAAAVTRRASRAILACEQQRCLAGPSAEEGPRSPAPPARDRQRKAP